MIGNEALDHEVYESEYLIYRKYKHDSKRTYTVYVMDKVLNVVLSVIKWHGPWRKYCEFREPDTIFDEACNRDIADYIKMLMDERKVEKRLNK